MRIIFLCCLSPTFSLLLLINSSLSCVPAQKKGEKPQCVRILNFRSVFFFFVSRNCSDGAQWLSTAKPKKWLSQWNNNNKKKKHLQRMLIANRNGEVRMASLHRLKTSSSFLSFTPRSQSANVCEKRVPLLHGDVEKKKKYEGTTANDL